MENSLIESVKALLHNGGIMRMVAENPDSLLAHHYNRICSLLEEKPPMHVVDPPPRQKVEADDVAYTMHQLQMLINYLEDLGIKAKWEGELWAVEQSGILLKFLDWFDGDLGVLKNHESLIHEYFTEVLKNNP